MLIGPAGVWSIQSSASAQENSFTCSASALRLEGAGPLAGQTFEPVTANAGAEDCAADSAAIADDVAIGPLGTASVLFARTTSSADGSASRAGVADVTITLPGAPVIQAEILTANADATCAGGSPVLAASSTVARVQIGEQEVEPVDGPQTFAVPGAGALHLNHQSTNEEGNQITQRALFLETPLGNVIVAEAVADFHGNPCDGPPPPECSDGVDNDGDGKIDYPTDPGCSSPEDDDETDENGPPECSDGVDNDGDGKIDYPNDPGCSSPEDDDETDENGPPECSDGVDNDGDGKTDHPADPGCSSPEDDDETDENDGAPQCSDELDNDGDGKIDYPTDPGCASPQDDDETDNGTEPECSDGEDNDGDGRTDYPSDPGCDTRDDDDETDDNPECFDGVDNDGDGASDFPADSGCTSPDDDDEAQGFMNGGGGYDEDDGEDVVEPGTSLRYGTTLPCDLETRPANLVVTFLDERGNEAQFKLDDLTRAFCRDDPYIDPDNPDAEFDTYVGEGTGTLKAGRGAPVQATAEFILIDRGEPGSPRPGGIDVFQIEVTTASGAYSGCCTLDEGNNQALPRGAQPSQQTTKGGKAA